MNCPQCKKGMEVIKHDESKNHETGKVYDRTIYQCKECDVWVTTEIPKDDGEEK